MKKGSGLFRKKELLLILVVASLFLTLLTPLSEVKNDIQNVIVWFIPVVLFTEFLFIAGLGLMAFSVGVDLGLNVFKWKKQFKGVVKHIPENKTFWLGFWVNAAGAVGTAVAVATGIISALPPQSWGLLWLAFLDLFLTIAIRSSALKLRQELEILDKA